MAPNHRQCSVCSEKNVEFFHMKDHMERLLFLIIVFLSKMVTLEAAIELMKNEDNFFCASHFFEVAVIMKDLVELTVDGWMAPIAIRIIGIVAGDVIGKTVEVEDLEAGIRVYLENYSEKMRIEFLNNPSRVAIRPYPSLKTYEKDTIRCLQCGQERLGTDLYLIKKVHEKTAIKIFFHPFLSGIMSSDQTRVISRLSTIPMCLSHLEDQGWTMKQLESKIFHHPELDDILKDLKKDMNVDLLELLKATNCFINKFVPVKAPTSANSENPSPLNRCKFCKYYSEDVFTDNFFTVQVHWGCMVARTHDIQWDMRKVRKDDGITSIYVPSPESLIKMKGRKLAKLMEIMKGYFGGNEVVELQQERIRIVALFARYWKKDEKIDEKIAAELERIQANRPAPERSFRSYDTDYENVERPLSPN